MMEFDEIVVKESPGLCRCCLSEGCYKDLGTEYTWMNETEVYADMLLECFDISITQHNEGPNGPNRLICEVCITRLRDACNFKKQVMDSEKKFIDMMGRGEFRPKMLIYQTQLKCEVSAPMEEPIEDADIEYLEDETDFGDDDLKDELTQPSVSDVTASTLPVKGKRGRPRKNTPVKPEKRAKAAKVDDKAKSSKAVAKGEKRRITEASSKSSMTSTKRNRLMKTNAIIVLENSTVVPFKWHRQNYLCFFCHLTFKDTNLLKEHTRTLHKKSSINAAVSYLRRDEKVKIDISDLQCRPCYDKFEDLNALIDHLKDTHKIEFTEECGYGLIPYFLQNDAYHCAVCKEEFHYFMKLNQHMNEHYGNYICELCGKSFLSQDRLRCHSLTHGSGFHCNLCPESFDSLTQKNNHESKVHNKEKLLRCFFCEETFQNYNQRKRHHNLIHDIKAPEFSCPVCGKTFHIMSKMKVHLKEVHIREKNFSCSMCEQKFFSRTHVQKHMVKHFGERVHQCEVCKKSYARKQTLKDHMRIHSSEKKFVCSVCSQGFVQNNSMRLHMKVHHPEAVIGKKPKKYKSTESSSMRRRRNLQILFNNTSIIPFKWRGKYLCFYCSKDIAEYTELRNHTKAHGNCSIKDHSLKVLKGGKNMEIKVDISCISCEVCAETLPSFDEIIAHLFDKHALEYDKGVEMAIEEYKLASLSCTACDETFSYFGYLVSHVNNNHPKNCHICENCNQKFNKRRDLFSHVKNYHREGGYKCEMCPQVFSSMNILRKHRNNRHLTRCNICNLKLPSASMRQKHIDLEHPDDGSLQCDACFKEFHTKRGLKMHARKCKGEEIFGIAIKEENSAMDLDLDQNYEDPVKRPCVKQLRENIVTIINMSTAIPFNFYKNKFNCFYCSKDFGDSDLMREHTVIEHPVCDVNEKCIRKCRESISCVKIDISSLACKVCFESLTDLDNLIDHLVEKHDAKYDKSITTCLQPYRLIKDNMICPHCPNEVFNFFGSLLKHINLKHTNNNIICVYCGQTFRRDQNLRVHIWRHHRAGRFKCTICNADCNIPSRLYMHMARAHGVRAAKCPKCPDSFATQYERQKHLIVAHNTGHKCSYCGKLFTRNSFMNNHIRRTHMKEKTKECSVCNAKFFNTVLLRRHMVKHSGQKIYSCDVCGERFHWRKTMQTHRARLHDKQVYPAPDL